MVLKPALLLALSALSLQAGTLVFEGSDSGPGAGKHIVLVSGDEEYRSEEACPMLAKILNRRFGYQTTVLFAMHPDGHVDPNFQRNIPGTGAVASADLVMIATRFRDLPDEQLKPLADHLDAGKPVFGFRTATHAFRTGSKLGGIDWNNFGPDILGEGWVSHYGKHKVQGCRGRADDANSGHPILRGVRDVFAESDVYAVERVTPANATILMHGVVTDTLESGSPDTPGRTPQPAAWLRHYRTPNGKAEGTAFCSTMGASSDLDNEGLRRLFINAALFLTGTEPRGDEDVSCVDPFVPSAFGFHREGDHFKDLGLKPADYGEGNSPQSGPPLESLLE